MGMNKNGSTIISQCDIHIAFFMSIIWKCRLNFGLTGIGHRQFNSNQSVIMEKSQTTVSKQTLYISVLIVFIIGFICGVVFTVMKTGDTGPATTGVPQQTSQDQEVSQAILNLEAEVTANPDNNEAWTRLGHLYFDSDQVDKAIGAYTKSLELNASDPNVWTDLGVMYRRAGSPQKAIDAFDKAIALDASHAPSQFNKGVVLHFDLGKTDEAIASWESVLSIEPEYKTANGMHLHDLIDQVKNQPAADNSK